MSVVIDANLVAAMVLPLPYSEQATHKITTWKRSEVGLLAPLLLEYEVVAVLRKAVAAGWLTTGTAVEALQSIAALNIHYTPPTLELHEQALHWAERLGHSKTYDAQYLALAEHRPNCGPPTSGWRMAHARQVSPGSIGWGKIRNRLRLEFLDWR
jgi:predicted nucleic acid-binding protein